MFVLSTALTTAMTETITYVAPEKAQASFIATTATQDIVDRATEEMLGMKIEEVAEKYKIASTTLNNLVYSESKGDPLADNGYDRGIVQISRIYHPEVSDACAFDLDCALDWAGKRISGGYEWEWSVCSCIATARNLGVKIPKGWSAKDFTPNVPLSQLAIGDLVLFKYKNGLSHVAVFKGFLGGKLSVVEGNYIACKAPTTRLIDPADQSIIGYWRHL